MRVIGIPFWGRRVKRESHAHWPTKFSNQQRIITPPPLIGGGIKRCFCLTSAVCLSDVCLSDVCLSRTSGVTREQRGLGSRAVGRLIFFNRKLIAIKKINHD